VSRYNRAINAAACTGAETYWKTDSAKQKRLSPKAIQTKAGVD